MARHKSDNDIISAKREVIITAAVSVFAKTGFHATKMQDIANEAGVGKGTIYEYFSTKDELFLAVYDRWMDSYETAMKNAAESKFDPVSKADALIDTTVEFYEHHADHAAILLEFWAHALRSGDSHFLERIQRMKKTLASIGQAVTEQLQALKLFTDVDAESFSLLELGISDGIFLQWLLDGKAYSLRSAYKFRQSVLGLGLMSSPLKSLVASKAEKRMKEGFIKSSQTTE